MMLQRTSIGAVVLFVAVIFVWHFTARSTSPAYIYGGQVHTAEAEAHWQLEIKRIGPPAAYQEMVSIGRTATSSQAYMLAHTFGAALFAQGGVTALLMCGSEFSYGCYHQFMGDAISQLGTSTLKQLSTACETKMGATVLGCKHSLGLGLLRYFGYDLQGLRRALAECYNLDPTNPPTGCSSGVFMEYNIHELASYNADGQVAPRTFTQESVYTPCYDVKKEFQLACAEELPRWWAAASTPKNLAELFPQIGAYCHAMDASVAGFCFEGVGRRAAHLANPDVDKTTALCTAAAAERGDLVRCLAGAARQFRAEGVGSPLLVPNAG